MRKKLLIVLAVLAVMVVALVGFVAMQPGEFSVVRSAVIAAPPAVVFEQVNDFHKWEAWSPWAKRDPEAKVTFEGPAAGTGAIFTWAGNSEIGEGRMTIIESRPSDLIRIKLDFVKPFEATNNTEFTFLPQGDQTVVTWRMSGKQNFIGKAVCLVMNMDKMVGSDFEAGLAQMKSIVETVDKP